MRNLTPQIIHDPKRTDRHKLLMAELKTQNISNVNFWPAIIIDNDPITGCSESHKNIIRWAMKNQLDEVVIWEDDIKFTAPKAWYFFLHRYRTTWGRYGLFLGGSYYTKDIEQLNTGVRIRTFSGSHCMIVRKELYRHILNCPPGMHLDIWISSAGSLFTYYLCMPMIAIQCPGYSDIAKKPVDYSNMIPDNMIFRG